jgi:uncharacterized DUF497 family protein
MEFEWGSKKGVANERKHSVTFEEAAEVFADDHSSTVPDPDHSINEERFIISVELAREGLGCRIHGAKC